MELSDLELFVTVADELHFGRAARRAHLSQPALTYRISRLETDLGFTLFDRNRRRVALTPAGEALTDRARRLLADAADARRSTARIAAGEDGTVRLGFVGSALYSLVPEVVRTLRLRHPAIALELSEQKSAGLLRDIGLGRLDAGLVHLPIPGDAPVDGATVLTEPVGVALPAGHRLADRTRLQLAELSADPVVIFPRELEPDTYDVFFAACAESGFVPEVAQPITNVQTLLGMVAAGIGFGFVAASVAANVTRRGVVFLPLAKAPVLHTALVWPRQAALPTLARLRAVVDEVAGEMSQAA